MKIDVACDICSYQYRVPPEKLGQQLRCKQCETKFWAQEYVAPVEEDDSPDALTQLKEIGIRWGTIVIVLSFLGMIGFLTTVDPEYAAHQYKMRGTKVLKQPSLLFKSEDTSKAENQFEPLRRSPVPLGANVNIRQSQRSNPLEYKTGEYWVQSDSPIDISDFHKLPANELASKYRITILPVAPIKDNQILIEKTLRKTMKPSPAAGSVANAITYTGLAPIKSSEKPVNGIEQLQPGQLVLALNPLWNPYMIYSIEDDRILLRPARKVSFSQVEILVATIDQLQLAHDGVDDLVHVNMEYESPDQVPWKVD